MAHAGLVNTLLKMLLLRSGSGVCPGPSSSSDKRAVIVYREIDVRDCTTAFSAVCCVLMAVLERLSRGPECVKLTTNDLRIGGRSGSSGSSGAGSSEGRSLVLKCGVHGLVSQSGQVNSNGGNNGGSSSSTSTGRSPTPEPGLHELMAILVLGVVRLSNLWLRLQEREQAGSAMACQVGHEFMPELLQQDPAVAAIAKVLMLQPSRPAAGWGTEDGAAKLEARCWEGHALTHFHGLLMPSCGHFGCTNLAGVGDASLPTRRVQTCALLQHRMSEGGVGAGWTWAGVWLAGGVDGAC